MKQRIWELDFFRGIAIVIMIIFHFVLDLRDFYGVGINYNQGFWYYFAKIGAVLFISLSGINSTFSSKGLSRGLKIFSLGMLVTLVTYLYNPELFVRFGILHFLGISSILYYLLKKFSWKHLLIIASIITISGIWIDIKTDINFLYPFGIRYNGFSSLDYYPLIPWFGVYLYGTVLGKTIYKEKKSILLKKYLKKDPISLMGRHSLTIYLIHQPILLMILYVIFMHIK